MWNLQLLKRIDYRLLLLLVILMAISLLVISSTTTLASDYELESFFTPHVKKQLQFFAIGWLCFFFFSMMNYNKLREWTWILYVGMILLLIGLFVTPAIQNVHRWYKIGGFAFQPSEYAKLVVVIALSWFLDKKGGQATNWKTAAQATAVRLRPLRSPPPRRFGSLDPVG